MAICCATSSTMPLWAQQEWADPVVQTTTPNLDTEVPGVREYYILHVASQQFLTNGNSYNTQLSVGTTGQLISMEYGTERQPLYGQEPLVSGEGWKLNMLNGPTNSGFHEIYAVSSSQAYVDANAQGHTLWQILPNENGTYRIKIVDQDDVYGLASEDPVTMNGVWGVADSASTVVHPFVDKSAGEAWEVYETDWAFVTPEAYDAFMARKEFKPILEDAAEEGFPDIQRFSDIYTNEASTAEEIRRAMVELPAAVINWQSSGATPENPGDFTSAIINNDFTNGTNGWTSSGAVANVGHQGSSYTDVNGENEMVGFAEQWKNGQALGNDFDINQTLVGLPTGKYRLSATSIGYWQKDRTVTPTGVYLYAESGGLEMRAEAHTLAFGGNHGTEDPTVVPQPRAVSLEFYAPVGEVKVGFKTVETNCNWAGVDNFKLEYLGPVEGGMGENLRSVAAELKAQMDGYVANNNTYSAAGQQRATELLALAEEAASNTELGDDSLIAIANTIQAEKVALQADVAAYETLYTFVNTTMNSYFTGDYASLSTIGSLGQYRNTLRAQYNQKTFDPAQADSLQATADRMFTQAVSEALASGETTNVTGLAANPNFTGSNSGWTKTGANNGEFKYGNNVAEVWQGSSYEVAQELTGLPEGSYRITAQAFGRETGTEGAAIAFNSADPRANVLSYLFGNSARAKVPSVFEHTFASNEELAGNGVQVTNTGTALDGQWVVNGVAGAEAAFAAGDGTNFEVSIDCYVEADGVLRFGISMPEGPNSNNWTLFDNFRIEYLPGSMVGAVAGLEAKREEANTMLNDGGYMTEDAEEALTNAVLDADMAISDPDNLSKDTYEATLAALETAIELGTNAREAVQHVSDVATTYMNEYEDGMYDAYDPALAEELAVLADEALTVVDGDIYETIEDAEQAVIDMNNAYGTMMKATLDLSTASKDTPVDVTNLMRNPRFQTVSNGAYTFTRNGWDGDALSNEPKADGTFATDSLAEFFNTPKFEVYQTLYNLDQGYYRLKVAGFYRHGDQTPAAISHRDGTEVLPVKLYAQTESETHEEALPSLFSVVMNEKFTTSSMVLPDSLFPDIDQAYHCVVNGKDDAKVAMNHGFYRTEVTFYVKAGESLRLGLRKDYEMVNDWCPFDDFEMQYLGDGEENRPDAIGDVITDATAEVVATEWYTIDGMRIEEPKQAGIYVRVNIMSDGSKQGKTVAVK